MTYLQELEAAWQEHLAPRVPHAPRVISLFAGCGGSSLGYSMAGYCELAAVEIDPHAAHVLSANFPGLYVSEADVTKLDPEVLLRRVGIQPGELDVLDGSPPCQGFSMAGDRKDDDGRNSLFKHYVRILRALRPRALVMENVPGMVAGKMRRVFEEALRELKASGYRVRAWKLRAAWYGVPQNRDRMIFIGAREDQDVDPTPPLPTHRGRTCLEAVEGIPLDGRIGLKGDMLALWGQTLPGRGFNESHAKGHYYNSRKCHPMRPAPTLVKTVYANGAAGLFHWRYPRLLNIAEAKRIGSFPDGFLIPGEFEEQWARIGNSVPPLMMRAVAAHVRTTILEHGRELAAA